VLEAIRWVMGESSPKSMRGAGMDDVIFAGTALRPARDFAEVSLLVERGSGDIGGDAAIAPGEVEITRRIERGAGSAYRVNGRDVRQKDVALLFADAATGAHSPALVSQGKISAVIAAKPTERRLMLEEAAGIAGLHVRRKDAEQKLRATEANLTRLGELIGDMEARSGQLKRQARAAERYRAISADIKVAEARLIFARWREAAEAAEAAKAESEAADAAAEYLAQDGVAGDARRRTEHLHLADQRIAHRLGQVEFIQGERFLDEFTLRGGKKLDVEQLAEYQAEHAAQTRDGFAGRGQCADARRSQAFAPQQREKFRGARALARTGGFARRNVDAALSWCSFLRGGHEWILMQSAGYGAARR